MSTQQPTASDGAPVLFLDRNERIAVRREVVGYIAGGGASDIGLMMAAGKREEAHHLLERVTCTMRLLDAIGWTEQADAPDSQPVGDLSGLAAFAKWNADELVSSLRESESLQLDQDLQAIAALRRVAEAARR